LEPVAFEKRLENEQFLGENAGHPSSRYSTNGPAPSAARTGT
jgi:hypothetical protein